MFNIHFQIDRSDGKISLIEFPGDTKLNFTKRKSSTIKSMGEALIKIAQLSEDIQYENCVDLFNERFQQARQQR